MEVVGTSITVTEAPTNISALKPTAALQVTRIPTPVPQTEFTEEQEQWLAAAKKNNAEYMVNGAHANKYTAYSEAELKSLCNLIANTLNEKLKDSAVKATYLDHTLSNLKIFRYENWVTITYVAVQEEECMENYNFQYDLYRIRPYLDFLARYVNMQDAYFELLAEVVGTTPEKIRELYSFYHVNEYVVVETLEKKELLNFIYDKTEFNKGLTVKGAHESYLQEGLP